MGIPYKEAIVDFCDEVHPVAQVNIVCVFESCIFLILIILFNNQSIGAVNTIIRRRDDGKLVGYNTDCEAAIVAIEDALEVP